MTSRDAQTFAADWIGAWNSRDLNRILSHYSAEIIFLSRMRRNASATAVSSGKQPFEPIGAWVLLINPI
jgi:ketosteroid isomerase-like protein